MEEPTPTRKPPHPVPTAGTHAKHVAHLAMAGGEILRHQANWYARIAQEEQQARRDDRPLWLYPVDFTPGLLDLYALRDALDAVIVEQTRVAGSYFKWGQLAKGLGISANGLWNRANRNVSPAIKHLRVLQAIVSHERLIFSDASWRDHSLPFFEEWSLRPAKRTGKDPRRQTDLSMWPKSYDYSYPGAIRRAFYAFGKEEMEKDWYIDAEYLDGEEPST